MNRSGTSVEVKEAERDARAFVATAQPDELVVVLMKLWRIQDAAEAYFSETDNPSKDYLLLRKRREQLREAVKS
jgi:hypothetical protein